MLEFLGWQNITPGNSFYLFVMAIMYFDVSRRGKKQLESSCNINEGEYRSGEGGEEPA